MSLICGDGMPPIMWQNAMIKGDGMTPIMWQNATINGDRMPPIMWRNATINGDGMPPTINDRLKAHAHVINDPELVRRYMYI